MSDPDLERARAVMAAIKEIVDGRFARLFPADGPLSRDAYHKHVAFMNAGASYRERVCLMGNRCGKSVTGAYEVTAHLTGLYPDWWQGRRFPGPVKIWAAGDTAETTRDIIQSILYGPLNAPRTGMIPAPLIISTSGRTGVPGALQTILVRHSTGGTSVLNLKSFDQRRQAFQGTSQDMIWLDEEPPEDIRTESLLRTMATGDFGGGVLMMTFTPLQGLTPLVLDYLPGGAIPDGATAVAAGSRYLTMATWDDAAHLSQAEKDELWASIPPYQRDARSKGVPQLGSGAIYPVPESDIVVPDFIIPAHWPRGYGMDVGWNKTAVVWGALDRENDVLYLTGEYYRGEAEPVTHTAAIQARGKWVPGRIDPASRGRSQVDGRQLLQQYRDLGLNLETAQNAVESGIYEVWSRFTTGRLKVFRSLTNFLTEYRLYRRDDKGRVVKQLDHLQDSCRYICSGGLDWLRVQPVVTEVDPVMIEIGPVRDLEPWNGVDVMTEWDGYDTAMRQREARRERSRHPSVAPVQDDIVFERERREAVHVALSMLGPKGRDSLEWTYGLARPITELATKRNVKYCTARASVQRALRALRHPNRAWVLRPFRET